MRRQINWGSVSVVLSRPLSGLTVLVVDDERDTTAALSMWLELRGAIAIEAWSVADAREIMRTIDVDVVLSDIAMPIESGLALIRWLRSTPLIASVPAIAISGVMRPNDQPSLIAAGFNSFYAKPVRTTALEAEISALTRR